MGTPELKAFRAFPPEHSGNANQCPDGTIQTSEQLRLEHWGSCWNRYYELEVEYYMSSTSRQVLESLTKNYLWMTNLKRNSNEEEQVHQLQQVASGWKNNNNTHHNSTTTTAASNAPAASVMMMMMDHPPNDPSRSQQGALGTRGGNGTGDWQPGVAKLQSIATQELSQTTLRQVQQQVFQNNNNNGE
jgi:COP9 signalosome complex subunit 5